MVLKSVLRMFFLINILYSIWYMYGSQFAAQLGICMGPNLVSSVAPPYPLFGQEPPPEILLYILYSAYLNKIL